jgi:ribosomal protein S4
MQLKKLLKFKKNSKLIRLNKLYSNLIKTKHLLNFFIGGLKRHQFSKLYKVTLTKQLFLAFLTKLECRLEFILLKSGFVLTGKQAKQLILHGHIFVNGFKVKAYNYQLKLYDLISVNRCFVSAHKDLLICNLFKTVSFFNFLRKKRIIKKVTISQLFVYFKFPFFLEINYKTFTSC